MLPLGGCAVGVALSSLPPGVLSLHPSQALCFHISVVTWSSLSKAEGGVRWRRDDGASWALSQRPLCLAFSRGLCPGPLMMEATLGSFFGESGHWAEAALCSGPLARIWTGQG